ncbi:hypothetical protein HF239_001704 [Campylobacter jejuni]|nr:hypothetical protein [Campylobacter jejuni]
MAKKIIDTQILAQVGQGAEMKENKTAKQTPQTQEPVIDGLKIFTLSLKVSEYVKLKTYCQSQNLSIAKFFKEYIREKGII